MYLVRPGFEYGRNDVIGPYRTTNSSSQFEFFQIEVVEGC